MSETGSLRKALEREVNKLKRQEENMAATKSMIELLEKQIVEIEAAAKKK